MQTTTDNLTALQRRVYVGPGKQQAVAMLIAALHPTKDPRKVYEYGIEMQKSGPLSERGIDLAIELWGMEPLEGKRD